MIEQEPGLMAQEFLGVVELAPEQMDRFVAVVRDAPDTYPPQIVDGNPVHPEVVDYLSAAVDCLIGDRTVAGTASELEAALNFGEVTASLMQTARGVLAVADPTYGTRESSDYHDLVALVNDAPAVDYAYQEEGGEL